MKPVLLLVVLLALAAAPRAVVAAPILAGNPGLKGQTIDAEGLKALLLGKRVTLGDTRVVIIIAKAGDAQEALLKQSVSMTTSQFQNHWRRLFMTGGGSAPKIVDTEADAIKLASETTGGVALVSAEQAGGLAVLTAP